MQTTQSIQLGLISYSKRTWKYRMEKQYIQYPGQKMLPVVFQQNVHQNPTGYEVLAQGLSLSTLWYNICTLKIKQNIPPNYKMVQYADDIVIYYDGRNVMDTLNIMCKWQLKHKAAIFPFSLCLFISLKSLISCCSLVYTVGHVCETDFLNTTSILL